MRIVSRGAKAAALRGLNLSGRNVIDVRFATTESVNFHVVYIKAGNREALFAE